MTAAIQVKVHGTPAEAPETSLFGAPWLQAVAGVVVVAWFYFVGWVYTYFYFRFFHIDIFEVDVPLEFIVMQATTPILFAARTYGLYLVAFAAVAAIILIAGARSTKASVVAGRRFFARRWRLLLLCAAAPAVFLVYYASLEISERAANHQAQLVWMAEAPDVQFSFSKDETDALEKSQLGQLNASHALRYLFATKEFYYVFVESPPVTDYMPDGLMFKVRTDAVDYVWIRRRGGWIDAQ